MRAALAAELHSAARLSSTVCAGRTGLFRFQKRLQMGSRQLRFRQLGFRQTEFRQTEFRQLGSQQLGLRQTEFRHRIEGGFSGYLHPFSLQTAVEDAGPPGCLERT